MPINAGFDGARTQERPPRSERDGVPTRSQQRTNIINQIPSPAQKVITDLILDSQIAESELHKISTPGYTKSSYQEITNALRAEQQGEYHAGTSLRRLTGIILSSQSPAEFSFNLGLLPGISNNLETADDYNRYEFEVEGFLRSSSAIPNPSEKARALSDAMVARTTQLMEMSPTQSQLGTIGKEFFNINSPHQKPEDIDHMMEAYWTVITDPSYPIRVRRIFIHDVTELPFTSKAEKTLSRLIAPTASIWKDNVNAGWVDRTFLNESEFSKKWDGHHSANPTQNEQTSTSYDQTNSTEVLEDEPESYWAKEERKQIKGLMKIPQGTMGDNEFQTVNVFAEKFIELLKSEKRKQLPEELDRYVVMIIGGLNGGFRNMKFSSPEEHEAYLKQLEMFPRGPEDYGAYDEYHGVADARIDPQGGAWTLDQLNRMKPFFKQAQRLTHPDVTTPLPKNEFFSAIQRGFASGVDILKRTRV